MTRGELKDSVRRWLRAEEGESDSDRYWTESDLNEYAQDAVDVFCRLSKLIRDSLTPSVCLLTLNPEDQHIALSPLILSIERVKPSWGSYPLRLTSLDEVTRLQPAWEDDTGSPDAYLLDYSKGYLSLNRAVVDTGTLRLTVRRMPLLPLDSDNAVPEINPEYHHMLKDYMLYRAFSAQDSEMYNPDKARHHLVLFQGNDEQDPGGHIGRVLKENSEPLPNIRRTQFF
jgi:hypothetical protein